MLNQFPRGQRKGLWSSVCLLSFWSHFCLKEEMALRIPELMGLWFANQETEPQKGNVWELGAQGDRLLQVFISIASQPLQYNCSLSAPPAVYFSVQQPRELFSTFVFLFLHWFQAGGEMVEAGGLWSCSNILNIIGMGWGQPDSRAEGRRP